MDLSSLDASLLLSEHPSRTDDRRLSPIPDDDAGSRTSTASTCLKPVPKACVRSYCCMPVPRRGHWILHAKLPVPSKRPMDSYCPGPSEAAIPSKRPRPSASPATPIGRPNDVPVRPPDDNFWRELRLRAEDADEHAHHSTVPNQAEDAVETGDHATVPKGAEDAATELVAVPSATAGRQKKDTLAKRANAKGRAKGKAKGIGKGRGRGRGRGRGTGRHTSPPKAKAKATTKAEAKAAPKTRPAAAAATVVDVAAAEADVRNKFLASSGK